MKKLLIGLAAGAIAVTATGVGTASAAGTSVYDQMTDGRAAAKVLVDASGLASDLDNCGKTGNNNGLPDYTVFFPVSDAIFSAVLDSLGLTLGELAAQPALVKQVLLYHVHKGNISPTQLADNSNTTWQSMGGLTLVKTTQTDGFFGYVPVAFDADYDEAISDILDSLYGLLDSESAGVFSTIFTPSQFENYVRAALLAEYPGLPAAQSFYINGYRITNAGVSLGYSTDFNTWFDGVDEDRFLLEVQLEIAGFLARVGSGQVDWDEGIGIVIDELLQYVDTADDEHTVVSREVFPGAIEEACNGWVYTIAGLLAPVSALNTQGTNTLPAATATTGSLPKTGSESMVLTYAALASLIAGAGVLVIRRRSVA